MDGVFIDFSPEGALNKLITLSKSPFNERFNIERERVYGYCENQSEEWKNKFVSACIIIIGFIKLYWH